MLFILACWWCQLCLRLVNSVDFITLNTFVCCKLLLFLCCYFVFSGVYGLCDVAWLAVVLYLFVVCFIAGCICWLCDFFVYCLLLSAGLFDL